MTELTIRRVIDGVLPMLQCKTCWRVTFVVLICLVIVESVILLFSVRDYRHARILEIEREGLTLARAFARISGRENGTIDTSELGQMVRDNSVLLGATIHDLKGQELSGFGIRPVPWLNVASDNSSTVRRFNDHASFDVSWGPNATKLPYFIRARLSAAEIDDQVDAYIWRVTALVFLITGVLTLITMIGLEILVLRPLRVIRQTLIRAAQDLEHPTEYMISESMRDEWGEVARSANTLLRQTNDHLKDLDQKALDMADAKQAAERANHAKSKFVTTMNHELITPLNSVLGFSQLLESDRDQPLSEVQKESVGQIYAAGSHLLGLISEILDLSSIEAGRVSLSVEALAPDPVIDHCVALVHSLADQRDIEIVAECAEDICPNVVADPKRFRQILLNLLSNSIKYNKHGGRVCHSRATLPEGLVKFSVSDTGPGIDLTRYDEIFEPFSRLDADATKVAGYGIGLSVTKQLVELMGGTIGVESTPENGCTFWFTLPVEQSRHLPRIQFGP